MLSSRPFGRSFNGIFREIEREMEDIENEVDDLIQRARKAGSSSGAQPLVYGWSLQIGPDGVPHFERFGNVGSQAELEEAVSEGWQAPYTTWHVDEDKNALIFTADLPGIQKDQLDVEILEPDCIKVEAEGGDRKYRTTCRLPVKLDAGKTKATFHNGVLDMTIGLAQPAKPKGKKVKVT